MLQILKQELLLTKTIFSKCLHLSFLKKIKFSSTVQNILILASGQLQKIAFTQPTFNRNTETMFEICSKLTVETVEWRQWRQFDVFIANLNRFHILLWCLECWLKQLNTNWVCIYLSVELLCFRNWYLLVKIAFGLISYKLQGFRGGSRTAATSKMEHFW